MSLTLSILDQSPVNDTETAAEAFQHTIELAQKAEAWGYHRFWVSEHHGSDRVMGSSPEVLIAHLLAKTTRMRVGSGGVMLQHYSPYKVAENFNVLASLAPGRVDLGIGRGPGGLPRSTRALQQGMGDRAQPFAEKLLELEQFLHNRLEENHPLYGLRVSPVPPQPAEVFLLGTTTSSAELAACTDDLPVRKNAQDIITQVDFLSQWVRELLLYSRPISGETEPVDLCGVLDSLLASFAPTFERYILTRLKKQPRR